MNNDKKHHGIDIQVNEIDEKKKASLRNRLLVAAGMAVTGIPCIILGGWFWLAYVFLFLTFAVYEVLKASKKKYSLPVWIFTYLLVYSYVFWFLIKDNASAYVAAKDAGNAWSFSLEGPFSSPWISIFAMATGIAVYCFFAVLHEDFTFQDAIYLFTMSFVLGIGFQCLLFIRFFPMSSNLLEGWNSVLGDKFTTTATFRYWTSVLFLLFVFLVCMMNDVMAYFVGILFGRHHMNERISPNKTWEGFFGGWILSALIGIGFAMIVEACGFPILPTLRIFGENSAWWCVVIVAFAIPVIGDLGDFTFSMIKRYFGIKDYSKVLGAHGGILDRVDSLLFTAVAASLLAVLIQGGWNFLA